MIEGPENLINIFCWVIYASIVTLLCPYIKFYLDDVHMVMIECTLWPLSPSHVSNTFDCDLYDFIFIFSL